MRIVVAPDKFAGTLTAPEAARAIGDGWVRRAPDDVLVPVPMSDGGPGFVDVLHEALGGQLLAITVSGPYDEPVPAMALMVDETAYVESAQAVGLHLTPANRRQPQLATSAGVGELVREVVEAGASRVVVGLGGSATNDGGAGVLAALGATCEGGALDAGPRALAGVRSVDVTKARALVEDVELVIATDVDNPLTGLLGATKNFGPQKGLAEDELLSVDGYLETLVAALGHEGRLIGATKGAGAAGGIGFALMLLGATRTPGVEMVADAVGLPALLRGADLVVTGEGAFDFSSRSGKVPYGVAQLAAEALVPCIALAGDVLIGAREMRTLGVESAYSLVDLVGSERAFGDPAGSLEALAERVARSWSR